MRLTDDDDQTRQSNQAKAEVAELYRDLARLRAEVQRLKAETPPSWHPKLLAAWLKGK